VSRSGIAGLTLGLHYLSFEAMREHAQDVAAVIDDIERLNLLARGSLQKMQPVLIGANAAGTLRDAIQQSVSQRCAVHSRRSAL
jgi:hypothetical protein